MLIIVPSDGEVGGTPTPRNDSVASSEIEFATCTVATTISGSRTTSSHSRGTRNAITIGCASSAGRATRRQSARRRARASGASGARVRNGRASQAEIAGIDEQLEAQKEGDDKETKNNHLGLWKNALKTHGVESVEDLFKKVFDGILKNHKKPEKAKRERKPEFKNKEKTEVVSKKAKKGVYTRKLKLTNEQRKAAAKKKIDDLKALVAK